MIQPFTEATRRCERADIHATNILLSLRREPALPSDPRKSIRHSLAALIAALVVIVVIVHFATRSAASGELTWMVWLVTVLCLIGIASGIRMQMLIAQSVNRPAAHLVEIARAVMHGHEQRRASLETAGPLRAVAEALNRMMDARQEAVERLKVANESLELKVHARTAELWRANKALREESEQRALAEREFQQAQKMEALGKLAGSIAHDFNNLLTVIIGGVECAQQKLPIGHPALSMLESAQNAAERAAGLTKPLLTFSRTQVLSVELVDLNQASEEASRMLHRLLGVNVELRLDLQPTLRAIKANANQVQQVLMNLAVNARDAMEGMGLLIISTRDAVVDREMAFRHSGMLDGHWIELSVRDTGCGMDAATKARIFEPFFTTKPVGKGTGLGLATVFGIVRQMGGFIEVESAVGEGTAFRLFLPGASEADLAAAQQSREPVRAPRREGANEMLLLVDDEDDIRELAGLALEGAGYRVLSAANAEEAILLGEEHAQEIRVLITDVVMPGISGVQLAELLSRRIPNLRVLFVSGHSNEAISAESLLASQSEYLQKPYRSDGLVCKVGEMLSDNVPEVFPPGESDQLVADAV